MKIDVFINALRKANSSSISNDKKSNCRKKIIEYAMKSCF